MSVGQIVVHCPLCQERIIATPADRLYNWTFACSHCSTTFTINGLSRELMVIQNFTQAIAEGEDFV